MNEYNIFNWIKSSLINKYDFNTRINFFDKETLNNNQNEYTYILSCFLHNYFYYMNCYFKMLDKTFELSKYISLSELFKDTNNIKTKPFINWIKDIGIKYINNMRNQPLDKILSEAFIIFKYYDYFLNISIERNDEDLARSMLIDSCKECKKELNKLII